MVKKKLPELIYVNPNALSDGEYAAGTAKALLREYSRDEMEAGEYKLVRRVLLVESIEAQVAPAPKSKPKKKAKKKKMKR